MNKIFLFFPLNRGIQKREGKRLAIALLKYLVLWIVGDVVFIILSHFPLIGNLAYNLGRLFDMYCPIGMISSVVQFFAVTDESSIEYISFSKIKGLFANKKIIIGAVIVVLVLGMIPRSVWTGRPKKVEKKVEVAESEKEEVSSADAFEADKNDKEAGTESEADLAESTEESSEEILTEVPDELKSVQGYVDENGEIVYAEWTTDSDCWWALRNYANAKDKLPVYAKTVNGDIRYDLTWDYEVDHWHLVKYVDDVVESDELYDDEVIYPVGYNEADSTPAVVLAREHSFEWGFPAEEVFEHLYSLEVDDYGNEYRLFKNEPNKYFMGVRVKDPRHIKTSITIKKKNLADGLNEGDSVPVISILSWPMDAKKAVIPSHIVRIEEEGFRGCSELEEVIMPDGLYSIGKHAFYGCKNLKSVTFGNRLNSIESGAFSDCENLKEISLPDSVDFIEHASVQFHNIESITWNGKNYTDVEEFKKDFEDSGAGTIRGDLSTYGS